MSFAKWITTAVETNDSETILAFPKLLQDKGEFQILEHCKSSIRTTGEVPTMGALEEAFEDLHLYIARTASNATVRQLFAEAKLSNFKREAKKINKENRDLDPLALMENLARTQKLWRLVAPASGPHDYTGMEIYKVPENSYSYKYNALNAIANNVLGGEVVVLVGQKKSGKTWITLDLAIDAFENQNKKVYFTSLEMTPDEIQRRSNAMIGKYDTKIFRGTNKVAYKKARESFERENAIIKAKSSGEFIIPSKLTSTVDDVMRDIEEYHPDIVFLDSIYLFKDENGRPIQGDWSKLATMAAELKGIARKHDIQIFTNSQLKRGARGSDLSTDDIAFSDSFAQTFDCIMAVSSDGEVLPKSTIQVLESRNGSSGFATMLEMSFRSSTISEVSKYANNVKKENFNTGS